MCFDKGNQSDQYLQVTYQICFLTEKIQKIQLNFVFWQAKSNKFISICVLTGKNQQIDLNFCFDMKIQKSYFNLCFDKANQSDQYLHVTYHIFSNQICFLTEKIQKIELNFVFWQVKSNRFICICVLTGKVQQIDMNFCFDMKIQINSFEFVCWQRKSIW